MENTETKNVILSFEEAKKVSDAERKLLDLLIAKNLFEELGQLPRPEGRSLQGSTQAGLTRGPE